MSRFSLVEADPVYAKLLAQREGFERQQRELVDEDRRIIRELAAAHFVPTGPSDGARQLLNGAAPAPNPNVALRRRQSEIRASLPALEEASEIVRSQLVERRVQASRPIVDKVRGEHKSKVARLAEAVVELALAYGDYLDFTDELNGAQIAWASLHPMHGRPWLGDPRTTHNAMRSFLSEAVENEFVPASMLARLPKSPRG